MIVHPAALRPIPRTVSSLGTILGLVFLVLVVGVIRPGSRGRAEIALSYFGEFSLDSQRRSKVSVSSVRSNSASIQLELAPKPSRVNERGAIFFRRADGQIFPVVAEGWVERSGARATSIFVSPADAVLLTQLSEQGLFLWKALEEGQESPFRTDLERRVSVLMDGVGHGVESGGSGKAVQIVSHTVAGDQTLTAETPLSSLPGPVLTVPSRESVIWFPGERQVYLLRDDGQIDSRTTDGSIKPLER